MNPSLRARVAVLHLLVLTLSFGDAADAASMRFGKRTLEISAPLDFVPIAASAPRRLQMMQAYLPQTSRLAEVYTRPAAAAQLKRDDRINLDRYFEVQVARKQEGVPATSRIIAASDAEIDAQLRKLMGSADRVVADLAQRGNAELKRTTAQDPGVSLNNMRYVHIYRHEPWGVFLTMKGRLDVDGQSEDVVGSYAMLAVNFQLIDLYAFSQLHGEADMRWTESALSDWADAVHRANPDDPAIAATVVKQWTPEDFGRIGQILGGAVGVGATLLWGVYRKRKR